MEYRGFFSGENTASLINESGGTGVCKYSRVDTLPFFSYHSLTLLQMNTSKHLWSYR